MFVEIVQNNFQNVAALSLVYTSQW